MNIGNLNPKYNRLKFDTLNSRNHTLLFLPFTELDYQPEASLWTLLNQTHNLNDEDFGDNVNELEKESIKTLTDDESFSQPKSYGCILAEEFVHARSTVKRSYGSIFTSALIAGLEIGISFIMLLSVYALLVDLMPTHYALTIASLL